MSLSFSSRIQETTNHQHHPRNRDEDGNDDDDDYTDTENEIDDDGQDWYIYGPPSSDNVDKSGSNNKTNNTTFTESHHEEQKRQPLTTTTMTTEQRLFWRQARRRLTHICFLSTVTILPDHTFRRFVYLQHVRLQFPSVRRPRNNNNNDNNINTHEVTITTKQLRLESIGSHCFAHCYHLKSFRCYNDNKDMSDYGEGTTSVSLQLPWGLTQLGAHAFTSCEQLAGMVLIPPRLISICAGTFADCTSLERLVVASPSSPCCSYHPQLRHVGSHAFSHCTNLQGHLALPYTVQTVGVNAFAHCSSLERVQWPWHVTVGAGALAGCIQLRQLILTLHTDQEEEVDNSVVKTTNTTASLSSSTTKRSKWLKWQDGVLDDCPNLCDIRLERCRRQGGNTCCRSMDQGSNNSGVRIHHVVQLVQYLSRQARIEDRDNNNKSIIKNDKTNTGNTPPLNHNNLKSSSPAIITTTTTTMRSCIYGILQNHLDLFLTADKQQRQ